jgi:S-adenosyl methyltransferase
MSSTPDVPPGVDPTRPSPARIYDCLLGGTSNFEADRAAAALLQAHAPELADAAWANRGFHQRAARWIAEQGVRQFLDIGSGLPTVGNTHEVVRQVAPWARVAYVDNDPMVRAYGRALLGSDRAATVIQADLREPEALLASPELRGLIDLAEPAGLLLTAVLHFIPDRSDPYGLVSACLAALAPGSYLALSHMTGDQKPPAAVQALTQVGGQAAEGTYLRSRAEVRRFFDGLELVPPYPGAEPDVTWVGLWNCEDPALADSEGSRWLYCGVARRPG